MQQLPDRPLVTGKGVALAVDLGDASRADRRKPKCPSENAANLHNGGADPVNAPPLISRYIFGGPVTLRNNVLFLSLRTLAERQRDEEWDRHLMQECGDECPHCLEEMDNCD